MYEFERSVLSKDQLAQKTGKDVGADVLVGSSGGRLLLLVALVLVLSVVVVVWLYCCWS